MPYELKKVDGKWCCFNKQTGENKGCSDSRATGVSHMRALYWAESGKTKEVSEQYKDLQAFTEESIKQINEAYATEPAFSWNFATSFEELDAQRAAAEVAAEIQREIYDAASDFVMLCDNVRYDPSVEDKLAAVSALAEEMAQRLGKDAVQEVSDAEDEGKETKEVSENMDSWWTTFKNSILKAIGKRSDVTPADKKRAEGEYGDVNYADETNKKYPLDTEAHIRAANSYFGMPKNRRKYSAEEIKKIQGKINAAWNRVIGKKKELSDEWQEDDFSIWKELNGESYRWFARYSNNFLDRDNPQQIISAASHKGFVERVEKGIDPLPELWLWHVKEWKIGQSDWIALDERDNGVVIAMASGTFDEGVPIELIDWLDKHSDELGTSHGMPYSSLEFDPNDNRVITRHTTKEISPLFDWAAANPITNFCLDKEGTDMIPKNKKDELIAKGVPASVFESIEAKNAKAVSKALDENIEFKEAEKPAESTEPVESDPAVDEKKETEPQITREEIADAVATLVVPRFEKIDELIARVNELGASLEATKKELAENKALYNRMTPATSLLAQMQGKIVGTKVEQSDPLLESKPKETAPKAGNRPNSTGVEWIDNMLGQSAG